MEPDSKDPRPLSQSMGILPGGCTDPLALRRPEPGQAPSRPVVVAMTFIGALLLALVVAVWALS